MHTVAVVAWPGGQWLPLLFDGMPWLPSAVYVAADGSITTGQAAWCAAAADPAGFDPEPLRRKPGEQVVVSGIQVEVTDLLAAVLRRVIEQATAVAGAPIDDVRLVVSAGWGPARTTAARRAAHRAGCGDVTVVTTPVAVVRHVLDAVDSPAAGTVVPVGGYVAVCDVGGGAEASVLRREPTGFEALSTLHDPEAGGSQLDVVLAGRWTGTSETDPAAQLPGVIAAVRAAKELLSLHPTATVNLPAPYPPQVVTAADLRSLATPVLAQAADLVPDAVAAADRSLPELSMVVVAGGTARLPQAHEQVAAAVSGPPVIPSDPGLAAARGAADAHERRLDSPPPPGGLGPPLPPLLRAAGLAVPGLASVALLADFLLTKSFAGGQIDAVYRYQFYNSADVGYGLGDFVIKVNWGELSMAAVLALVSCLVAAVYFASLLPINAGLSASEGSDGTRMGAGLMAATISGLAIAAFYAVFAAEYIGAPPSPFLKWALLPLLPAALTVAVAAAAIARWRRRPAAGWHAWLHFPATSAITAALGILMVNASHWHSWAGIGTQRAGGFAVGVAAALALARPIRYRLAIGLPLGVFASLITGINSTGALAGVYLTAVTIWWLQRLWQITYQPPAAAWNHQP